MEPGMPRLPAVPRSPGLPVAPGTPLRPPGPDGPCYDKAPAAASEGIGWHSNPGRFYHSALLLCGDFRLGRDF